MRRNLGPGDEDEPCPEDAPGVKGLEGGVWNDEEEGEELEEDEEEGDPELLSP